MLTGHTYPIYVVTRRCNDPLLIISRACDRASSEHSLSTIGRDRHVSDQAQVMSSPLKLEREAASVQC
jgi:hypothetical protein